VSDQVHGLREIDIGIRSLFDLFWIPESEKRRRDAWDAALARICGMTVREVVNASDYRELKYAFSGRRTSVDQLVAQLIRPHASDSSNIAIQLRTTAELAMGLRFLQRAPQLTGACRMLVFDTTLTLPLVTRRDVSLFYEHLKRLCCVEARQAGVVILAVSKSHSLSGLGFVEDAVREVAGVSRTEAPEHWYLKIPTESDDGWTLPSTEDRRVPPAGAVSYLARFHRNVPILRVDLDAKYCNEHLREDDEVRRLFQCLDYCTHDQRCYGYPYPVKAGHDRALLTEAERIALRKQLIDEAVRAGLKRSLFRDASQARGDV
jgi:hypothetical protein